MEYKIVEAKENAPMTHGEEDVSVQQQMVMIEPRHPNRAGLDRALRVVLG